MTDKKIIQALKCCAANDRCWLCPMQKKCKGFPALHKNAIDLINRQKAKIESLEVSLESMRSVAKGFQSAHERAESKRKIAIQDFAERLKEKAKPHYFDNCCFAVSVEDIDTLANELISEKCENQV